MEEEYKDMLQEWQMKHIYSVDFYDRVLTQPGIEYYNGICGKINEHMNQFCQKNRINKMISDEKLHKQILCKNLPIMRSRLDLNQTRKYMMP